MKRLITFSLLLVFCLGATPGACAEKLSPFEVTEKFWTAVKKNDIQSIRQYVSSEYSEKKELTPSLLPIAEFELGKIIIDGEQALVETTVVVDGERPVTVPLETTLVREKGLWKVHYEETVAMLTEASELARALKGLETLAEQFSQKLDQSLTELQQSLPKVQRELKEIEKKLKAELPEIQKQLEGLSKEFEELFRSLQQPPSSEQEKAI
ncbi:hypothetical protein [Nitrosococcus wardiae]|uniref:DUF4878 domain-containing protein n=1 Tax=Nitrosococcus wardiae TaxID=1814290 RepID=A0A4P7C127_9GAMM|nr:hypothetical protein [Nitrosococcus wardiae]QBQ56081.1 hypothetical protein E3U44_17370 [Nitrosococcus wardiae]